MASKLGEFGPSRERIRDIRTVFDGDDFSDFFGEEEKRTTRINDANRAVVPIEDEDLSVKAAAEQVRNTA